MSKLNSCCTCSRRLPSMEREIIRERVWAGASNAKGPLGGKLSANYCSPGESRCYISAIMAFGYRLKTADQRPFLRPDIINGRASWPSRGLADFVDLRLLFGRSASGAGLPVLSDSIVSLVI
jgi:hypothetical protein